MSRKVSVRQIWVYNRLSVISDDETLFCRCPVRWCGRETHWRPRSEKTPRWRKESTSRRASLLNSPPGQMWELSNLFGNPWLLCFGSNMICLPNCPKFNFVEYSYWQQNDTLILEELVGDRLEEEEEQRGETNTGEEQEVSCWGYRGHVGQYEDIWYQWGGMDQIRMDQRIWVTHCEKVSHSPWQWLMGVNSLPLWFHLNAGQLYQWKLWHRIRLNFKVLL